MTLLLADKSARESTKAWTVGREWFRDTPGKLTLAVTAFVLLHVLYVFFHWGGDEYKAVISNVTTIVIYLITALYAWRAARHPSMSRRSRRAWRCISLANAAFMSGAVLWTYFENYLGVEPFPSVADAGYLSYFPLMMAGLLLLVEPMRSAQERAGFALDVTIMVIGCGLVFWYFLVQPMITQAEGFTLAAVLSIAYPVGDLVLLFGIVTILLRRRAVAGTASVTLVLIGVVGNFAADFIFGYQSLQGTYVTGNWVDALWTVGSFPIVLGAHYRYLLADRGTLFPAAVSRQDTFRRFLGLPYLMVVAAFVILIALDITEPGYHAFDLIVALLLTTLLAIRQFVYLRENTRAKAALSDLQERIQGIYSATSDGIGIADFEGNLVDVNEAFARLFGYRREELLSGYTILDLTAKDHHALTLEMKSRVIESQETVAFEKQYVRKDGSAFDGQVTVFPIKSHTGVPTAIAAIVRDVTAKKRADDLLHEAEERWQLALRVNRDGIWDWNLRSGEFYFSPRWREMFGFGPDETVPFSVANHEWLFHPDDLHIAKETRNTLFNGTPYVDIEFRHACKGGTYRWVRCRAEAVVNGATGRLERVIGLNTDIAERKRKELESRAMSDVLRGLSETSNLDELLSLVHEAVGRVVYARNFFVALHDKTTDLFSMQFFVDQWDEKPAAENLRGTRSHYVFRTGRPLLLDDETTAKMEAEGEFRLVGTQPKSWVGIPLRTPDRIIGVLVLQSYDDEHLYSHDDLQFLTNLGGPIAMAIERKRAESRMLLLNTALNSAANGVVITTGDGSIEWVNRAFSDLTGYSADEVRGQNPRVLNSGHHPKEFYESMWRTIKSGTAWKGELVNRRKNGELYDEEMTITPVLDESSRTNHFIAIKSDITERRKAQDALRSSEEQHRLLFESNPFPVYVYDLETLRFLAVNQATVNHYGYTRDEFLNGLTLADIRPKEDVPDLFERVAGVSEGHDTIARPSRHKKKDGTVTHVEITSHVISFAGRRAEIVLANDITERLAAEEQIRITNERLAQSNRELQDFAYVASHDLQEPLRKVQTFADRLGSKYADALDETGRDYLGRMTNAAHRMQTLIQDLLAFSRVTTKAQPFVPVDLDQITRDVLSDLEVKIEESGATVDIGLLPTIDADPSQMRQLMQNLIGNALKFHAPEVKPVVRVSAEHHANGGPPDVRISVEDNGIGFDEKYLDKIFTVFQRLHGRTEFEGSGIGLAVCRKIVERHHGTLTASSSPGKGAKFTFTLPMHRSVQELN